MQVYSIAEENFVCHFILCLEPPEDAQSRVSMRQAFVDVCSAVTSHCKS